MLKNLVFDVFFFAWRNLSVDVHHHVLATVVKDHANSYIGMIGYHYKKSWLSRCFLNAENSKINAGNSLPGVFGKRPQYRSREYFPAFNKRQ